VLGELIERSANRRIGNLDPMAGLPHPPAAAPAEQCQRAIDPAAFDKDASDPHGLAWWWQHQDALAATGLGALLPAVLLGSVVIDIRV
jgi:hypothetical protein